MSHIYETTLKMHDANQSSASQSHAFAVVQKPQEAQLAKVLESAAA